MKRSLAIMMFLSLSITPMLAQDDRLDELGFEEAPLKDEPIPYFAVGAGPVLNVAFPTIDDVNARAQQLGLDPMETPMLQWGGEIFSAIGIVPNIRVGFAWVSGELKTNKDMQVSGVDVNRSMVYDINQATIYADYAIVPAKGLGILPGVGFGWGSQNISVTQGAADRTWDDYADTTSLNTSPDAFSEVENNVLYLVPRLNIEYSITPFIAVRAQAAYTWQFSTGTWTGNRTSTVSGVPDGISVSAFTAQIGVFVGLFN